MSFTYLIIDTESLDRANNEWTCKIGRSAVPTKRVKELQTANPHRLLLLAYFPDTRWESLLHGLLDRDRTTGEWFRLDFGWITFIASIAERYDDSAYLAYRALEQLAKRSTYTGPWPCLLATTAFSAGMDFRDEELAHEKQMRMVAS